MHCLLAIAEGPLDDSYYGVVTASAETALADTGGIAWLSVVIYSH